jgi:hypothetical protein
MFWKGSENADERTLKSSFKVTHVNVASSTWLMQILSNGSAKQRDEEKSEKKGNNDCTSHSVAVVCWHFARQYE